MDAGTLSVLLGLFGLGLIGGFCMHRSDFCLAGAFRDLFLFRSGHLIRPLVLAVAVSALLFELARSLGFLPYYPFPWFAPPALVNLLGGMVFGLGMVLTGGCVVGVLYKFGGGSLLAGLGILGLVAGSALYAEIHPLWSAVAEASRLHDKAVTLPQLVGSSPTWWALGLTLVGLILCFFWWREGLWRRKFTAEGYIPLWVTALVLALVSLFTLKLSGIPMGITTSYAKMAAIAESAVVPGHVAETAYFSSQSVQLTLPLTGQTLQGGGGTRFDVVALVQYPLILGIVLGAFGSALTIGEFKPRWSVPLRQAGMVFCGGIIMALGSRMSPGCNVWHLLGGLPILTIQSLLFVVGLLPGAWLGSRLLQRVLA